MNRETRMVCDECGQGFGLFHKGCDGAFVEQSRWVTEWCCEDESQRIEPDALHTLLDIDPNDPLHQMATMAVEYRARRDELHQQVEALTSGRAAEYMRVGRAALKMQAEGGTQVLLADLIEEANK